MSSPTPTRTAQLLVRMPLSVVVGKRSCPVQSEAVWTNGLTVRCDLPVPARQLVKLQVPTTDGGVVALNAMVESVRAAAPGVAPALTVTLYGNSGPPVDKWNAFLAEIRARFPDATTHTVVSEEVTPETPDAVHRRHVRFLASFQVRVPNLDALMTFVTRDVSRGGMFLRTKRVVTVGSELQVELIHPTTKDSFPLKCVVRRRVTDGDAAGLGLEFVGLDAARQKDLWAFVSTGMPDEVDVELIEEE